VTEEGMIEIRIGIVGIEIGTEIGMIGAGVEM